MKEFNKLVVQDRTRVFMFGKWYLVKKVHSTRKWIEVYGMMGSAQYGHVDKFTNKEVPYYKGDE